MVVQHNMQAVNANRMLNITTSVQAKSTEKLSSGYRINRAADDAAGLAISEKMRKQIKGLDRASTNAQDGISAVQTAEGALNEVQSMLQRMNELSVQSANGTNSIADRTAIQNEIDQLTTEIDRVSQTTKFNETYLLKGDAAVTKEARFQYMSNAAVKDAAVYFGNNQPAGTDSTTGLSVQVGFTPASGSSAHQDDQNAIARSIRDSGLSVSRTHTWDATTGTSVSAYNLELTGDAAQQYRVVANTTMNANGEGVFEIQTRGGEFIATVTVSGGAANLPAATSTDQVHTAQAVISGTSATAARTTGHGESAEYFDRDGNRISNNALNRYVQLASGSITSATGNSIASTGGTSGTTQGNVSLSMTNAQQAWLNRLNQETNGADCNFTFLSRSSYNEVRLRGLPNAAGVSDHSIWIGDESNSSNTDQSSNNDVWWDARGHSIGTLSGGITAGDITTGDSAYFTPADISYQINCQNSGAADINIYNGNAAEALCDSANGVEGKSLKLTYNSTDYNWYMTDSDGNAYSWSGQNYLSSSQLGININNPFQMQNGDSITLTLNRNASLSFNIAAAGGSSSTTTSSSSSSGSTTTGGTGGIQVRGNAPLVYDAVGNLTSISTANIAGVRDITGALRLDLHVGADATKENKIQVNIKTMSSKALGVNGLRVDGSDSTNADLAIETIKEALQKVSDQRAELGAVQNRLEHTINNLDNVVENTESAESRIRDTDMAEEMVTYSKNNILTQAGQSMLAQANQSNQGVLSLLG